MSKINTKADKTNEASGHIAPSPVHDGIATKLRELYMDLENEGVPDELLNLLERLDQAERAQTARDSSEVNADG